MKKIKKYDKNNGDNKNNNDKSNDDNGDDKNNDDKKSYKNITDEFNEIGNFTLDDDYKKTIKMTIKIMMTKIMTIKIMMIKNQINVNLKIVIEKSHIVN